MTRLLIGYLVFVALTTSAQHAADIKAASRDRFRLIGTNLHDLKPLFADGRGQVVKMPPTQWRVQAAYVHSQLSTNSVLVSHSDPTRWPYMASSSVVANYPYTRSLRPGQRIIGFLLPTAQQLHYKTPDGRMLKLWVSDYGRVPTPTELKRMGVKP